MKRREFFEILPRFLNLFVEKGACLHSVFPTLNLAMHYFCFRVACLSGRRGAHSNTCMHQLILISSHLISSHLTSLQLTPALALKEKTRLRCRLMKTC